MEAWPDDDQDAIDPRGGAMVMSAFMHGTVIRAGATRETGLRICYVMSGQEYESEITSPEEDHIALMYDLRRKIRVPISAVRAYGRPGRLPPLGAFVGLGDLVVAQPGGEQGTQLGLGHPLATRTAERITLRP
jgi:hypothetical protein